MQKILFFDDEPFVTNYLVKSLQEIYGWTITYVSTIDDLLKEVKHNSEIFSLIVLDIMAPMPSGELKKQFTQQELDEMCDGMSLGLVMAKKIRQIEHYTKVPVLYLSARTSPYVPDSEKGYTAYIRKPVSPGEISKEMNNLLAKQQKQ